MQQIVPYRITGQTSFLYPTGCSGCREGLVYALASDADADSMKGFFSGLPKRPLPGSIWIFSKGNVIVLLDGSMPEQLARKYDAALQAMR